MKVFYLLLIFIVGCAHSPSKNKNIEELSLLDPKQNLSLQGLTPQDFNSLDFESYLLFIDSDVKELGKSQIAGVLFVNELLKKQVVSLNSIYLKGWIKDSLRSKTYYVDKLSSKTKIIILTDYYVNEIKIFNNKNESIPFFNRVLTLKALDYQEYKNNKKEVIQWEIRISSLGPSNNINKILPVLASFIETAVGTKSNTRYIISSNDPLLKKTQSVPHSIPVDDFKPSVEELNFFH